MAGISAGSYGGSIVKGTEDFEAVHSAMMGGYEWASFNAYYSPSARRFFWISDAGCSCTSPMDYVDSLADFEHGDRAALLAAWGRWSGTSYDGDELTADEKVAGTRAIRTYRAEVRP